jgi:hypothetical protein
MIVECPWNQCGGYSTAVIIEGEGVVNAKEEHEMHGRPVGQSFVFSLKQHHLENTKSAKNYGHNLHDEQGVCTEDVSQGRENHEVGVEVIGQEVFRYFFEDSTVVPIQIGVIVNGIVVDSEIEGEGSEVVVIDEGDGGEDDAEYSAHDEELDDWSFVLLGIQDDHFAGIYGKEDRDNC